MAKDKELTHDEKLDKVKKLINEAKIGALVTIAERGFVSRPMALQETEFDGDLWFVTFRDTPKVKEIEADPRVNVTFSDDDKNYVSIAGRAEIIFDVRRKKNFGTKLMKRFSIRITMIQIWFSSKLMFTALSIGSPVVR